MLPVPRGRFDLRATVLGRRHAGCFDSLVSAGALCAQAARARDVACPLRSKNQAASLIWSRITFVDCRMEARTIRDGSLPSVPTVTGVPTTPATRRNTTGGCQTLSCDWRAKSEKTLSRKPLILQITCGIAGSTSDSEGLSADSEGGGWSPERRNPDILRQAIFLTPRTPCRSHHAPRKWKPGHIARRGY